MFSGARKKRPDRRKEQGDEPINELLQPGREKQCKEPLRADGGGEACG